MFTGKSIQVMNLKTGISFETKNAILKLKKKPPEKLDMIVKEIHHEVFEDVDCLACAGCCKQISPRINHYDLQRLSTAVRMRPSLFTEKYLEKDKDGDYVFKNQPCPFLDSQNYCSVYNDRPSACKDYPHTNRRRFHQVLDLSITNADICPAVSTILEKLVHVTDK